MFSTTVLLAASMVVGQAEKPNVPENIVASMAYYIGTWRGEWREDGKACSIQFTAKWVPGKHCTLLTSRTKTPDGIVQETLLSGWDALAKEVVDYSYRSDGSHSMERWKIASPEVEEATSTGVSANGNPTKATYRIEKQGANKFDLKISDRKEGDQSKPDLLIKYEKIEKPEGTAKKKRR